MMSKDMVECKAFLKSEDESNLENTPDDNYHRIWFGDDFRLYLSEVIETGIDISIKLLFHLYKL